MKGTLAALAAICLMFTACGPGPLGETGTEIVDAAAVTKLMGGGNVVLVDANTAVSYAKRHAAGAVNIPRTAIVVNEPVPNLLAPPEQIESAMSAAGIGNDTLVLVYDDNQNMDAARLWFTLKAYGHDRVKVISGGLTALAGAGAELTTEVPTPVAAVFRAGPLRNDMFISAMEIRGRIENPPADWVLIDTRSLEEYNEGTIPGSVCLDFAGNNFSDGTFRPVRHIRIRYLEEKIDYDDEVAMYCKTSIRGAQTYLVLYNAGYRNLKLYDGAWVEWTANPMNPVYVPVTATADLTVADQS